MLRDYTNIFISYDNRLIYDGIVCLIGAKTEYRHLGGAPTGETVVRELEKKPDVDILIVEKTIMGHSFLVYLKELMAKFPDIKILLVAAACNIRDVDEFLDIGIYGWILKSCGREDMFSALAHLSSGNPYICTHVSQAMHKEHLKRTNSPKILTERESDVLKYLIDGYSNKQIAHEIKVSESTVKTHRKNMMVKFGSGNLLSMLRYACRENLVDFGMNNFCKCCPFKAD